MAGQHLWSLPILVCCLAVGWEIPTSSSAQEKPNPEKTTPGKTTPEKAPVDRSRALERKEIDVLIYRSLKGIIDQGADLYNAGDWVGCHRLYEGALLAYRPLLEHRPELQNAIERAIEEAARTPRVSDRAFVLRTVIDQTRKETASSLPRKDGSSSPRGEPVRGADATLWERLGSEKGVNRVILAFLDKASLEAKLRPVIRKNLAQAIDQEPPELKARLAEFLSSATGGPLDYKGKAPREAFKEIAITTAEYDVLVRVLKEVLSGQKIKPADAELVIGIAESARRDIVAPTPPANPAAPSVPPTNPPPSGNPTPAKTPPDSPSPSRQPGPTALLWQQLGGEKGVAQIIDDFINPALKDPTVNFYHDPNYKPQAEAVVTLKKKLRDLLAEASGGPLPNQTSGAPKPVVLNSDLSPKEYEALLKHLQASLQKNKIKLEDRKILLDNLVLPSREPFEILAKPRDASDTGGKNPE